MARIVRDDAAHAGRDLFGAAGFQIEDLIIGDVVSHSVGTFRGYPPDRNGLVKPRLADAAHICKHRGE
jgi:hypothetical protein